MFLFYQFFENFVQYILSHSPLPTTFNIHQLFFFNSSCQFVLPMYSSIYGLSFEHGRLTKGHTHKENYCKVSMLSTCLQLQIHSLIKPFVSEKESKLFLNILRRFSSKIYQFIFFNVVPHTLMEIKFLILSGRKCSEYNGHTQSG